MSARHSRRCKVCHHAERAEIEERYVRWEPLAKICRAYGIRSRSMLDRHVRANRLDEKRNGNIKGLVIAFLERGLSLRPTAASFVQAVGILARLDESGKMVDTLKIEKQETNPVFDRMSKNELLAFAEHGDLPPWLTEVERQTLTGTASE